MLGLSTKFSRFAQIQLEILSANERVSATVGWAFVSGNDLIEGVAQIALNGCWNIAPD